MEHGMEKDLATQVRPENAGPSRALGDGVRETLEIRRPCLIRVNPWLFNCIAPAK